MNSYKPLTELPAKANYKSGDQLVLFGELFTRGYANGLIHEAENLGMKIIYSTVGRRDESGLRTLNAEEVKNASQPLINVALEAGFDMEKTSDGHTVIEHLKDVKLDDWQNLKLNWDAIKVAYEKGRERFKTNVRNYFSQLEKEIDPSKNIFIAHLMAGGVPRAKIFMAVLNRVVKPKGDKFVPSDIFWKSDLGKLADMSFNEVTADTFATLVQEAQPLAEKIKSSGGTLRISAYGYHGTGIVLQDKLFWQSYAPYIQGWAKLRLEDHSKGFSQKGIRTCVYNCPEILTNSSSIFQGVEVPLYPLISSFKKWGGSSNYVEKLFSSCQELLKPQYTLDSLVDVAESFYDDPEIKAQYNIFDKYPQHNRLSQMQKLVDCSNEIINMHKDDKKLITFVLSEEILKGTGQLMLNDSVQMKHAVLWLNHDIIVKQILAST